MTEKLHEKAFAFYVNPTVCNWFQLFANETWDRIGFVRSRRGFKIFETTITQNLIFEYGYFTTHQLFDPDPLNEIQILESKDERANGNDIELFVQTTEGYLFFAIQAKIIYHKGFVAHSLIDGTYPQIGHKVGANLQIDLLNQYAIDKNGIPLYLLFNYVNEFKDFNSRYCEIDFGIEQFGCSIISTNIINNEFRIENKIRPPKFSELHPNKALPWFVIPCCFREMNRNEIIKKLKLEDLRADSLKIYSKEDITNDNSWKALESFSKSKPMEITKSENEDVNQIDYKPRFRIILNRVKD